VRQPPDSSVTLLLPIFHEEAASRGLLDGDAELSVDWAFALVRDVPYQRASSREPEAIIREWRGTCSGKHYLLKDLFEEMGFDARILMCTHQFTEDNTAHFPAVLRAQVSQGPIPDVHTFVRLKSGAGWMDVDATWPRQTGLLGMPVNEIFLPGVDMAIACSPLETLEVPVGVAPQAFKERLIESHCGAQSQRRDRFIEDMSQWLAQSS